MTNQINKIIGLDVGDKRIGVATASLIARLPQPHSVINRSDQTINDINELAIKLQATAIVIGLPRGLDGQDTDQTSRVRNFTRQLSKACNLPIHFQDEALTSKKAEQELNHRKVSYNKDAVDALAATYILSDFLEEHAEFKE